ncbi:hypothetical protein [[Clostridium] fimetarium]|uniref:Uncharacterized protein n=1 Tax=[Clostridium] fimetarium TaxID=99656 RepID=A0A1I0RDH2_9FIRM|nr:hypothetical protein [[Clostridium] fimetarium]SEW38906.1 hypothetical protein SAMN05421659_11460 [[Clostridium] fimetarium]
MSSELEVKSVSTISNKDDIVLVLDDENEAEMDEENKISARELAKGILSLMEKLVKMIDEKDQQDK